MQALREAERVVVDADFRRDGLVFEHVGHYEWQIVLGHYFFLVAEADDAFGDLQNVRFGQFNAQRLKIFLDIGLA